MEKIVLFPIEVDVLLSKVQDIVNIAIENKEKKDFQEKLISPAEVCELFNPKISKVTLHEWTKQGLIPAYRISGRVYYRNSEVIEAAKRIKKFDRDKQPAQC